MTFLYSPFIPAELPYPRSLRVSASLHASTTVLTPESSGDLDSTAASTSYGTCRSVIFLSLGSCKCEGGVWLFFPHTRMVVRTTQSGVFEGKNAVYKCNILSKEVCQTCSTHLMPHFPLSSSSFLKYCLFLSSFHSMYPNQFQTKIFSFWTKSIYLIS